MQNAQKPNLFHYIVVKKVLEHLSDLVAGHILGRESDKEITLFESQGIAISDIAAANFVYKKAIELGQGTDLPIDS